MCIYLLQRSRHTERGRTAEVDGTGAANARHLITAIDARQDMATADVHYGVATYMTCLIVP